MYSGFQHFSTRTSVNFCSLSWSNSSVGLDHMGEHLWYQFPTFSPSDHFWWILTNTDYGFVSVFCWTKDLMDYRLYKNTFCIIDMNFWRYSDPDNPPSHYCFCQIHSNPFSYPFLLNSLTLRCKCSFAATPIMWCIFTTFRKILFAFQTDPLPHHPSLLLPGSRPNPWFCPGRAPATTEVQLYWVTS